MDKLGWGTALRSRISTPRSTTPWRIPTIQSLSEIREELARSLGPVVTENHLENWEDLQVDIVKLLAQARTFTDQQRSRRLTSAHMIDGRPTVVIACSNRDLRNRIKDILSGPEAKDLLREYGFEALVIIRKSLRHVFSDGSLTLEAKSSTESVVGSRVIIRNRIHPYIGSKNEAEMRVTIGGVILVDGKFYGLVSAHGVYNLEKFHSNEFPDYESKSGLAHSNMKDIAEGLSLDRRLETNRKLRGILTNYRFNNEGRGTRENHEYFAADWGLIDLEERYMAPNSLAFPPLAKSVTSADDVLWPKGSSDAPSIDAEPNLLVENILYQSQLHSCFEEKRPGVECIVVTSWGVVPGFIALSSSTFEFDEASFKVVRVDIAMPLENGDSGSWVLVGNRLFGMVIAAEDGGKSDNNDDNSYSVDAKGFLENPSAYVIPIEDTFRSISITLSTTTHPARVSLPTLQDWRINSLRAHRQKRRGSSDKMSEKWVERHLDMELLLAQQKMALLTNGHREDLRIESKNFSTQMVLPHVSRPNPLSRFVLEDVSGLLVQTLDSIILLGEVCPLSQAFRTGFRQWLKDHRRFRFRNRRTFVSSTILDWHMPTQAGENVLGLVLIMWKTLRRSIDNGGSGIATRYLGPQIVWLAQLLSSLFGAVGIPVTSIPSNQQLQLYVQCILAAFKDKDLSQLHFIMDANRLIETAPSSDEHWTTLPPRVPSAVVRAVRWAWACISGHADEDILFNVDAALAAMHPAAFDHSITSTCRFLVQMMQIATGDGTRVLVCSGSFSPWAAFYAAVALGLEVEMRLKQNSGSRPLQSPYRRAIDPKLSISSDVVVYLDHALNDHKNQSRADVLKPAQLDMCEIIPRDSFEPLPPGHRFVTRKEEER